MFLQRVDNVFDLEWGGGVRYGEVRLREEVEQSKYAFDQDTGIDRRATFAAFHRDLFDENLRVRREAARRRAAAAGARALPEVLAPVQHARLERQHRRDRAHGLHPARAPARRRDLPSIRGAKPKPRRSAPSREDRSRMDRELLIEIGMRRDSRELAARPDDADRRAPRGAAEGAAAAADGAGRDLQHAAAADRARRQAGRAADRFRRAGDGPAGVGGVRRRRPADAGRRSASPRSTASSRRRSSGIETPKGDYLAYRKQQRGKAAVDVLPDVLAGVLRDMTFPKQMRWDA